MRPIELLRRSFRRSDTRAALVIGGLLVFIMGIQGVLLYAFVRVEGLEEADRWTQLLLETTRSAAALGGSAEVVSEAMRGSLDETSPVIRFRDHDGSILDSAGDWPPPDKQVPLAIGDDRRGWLSSQLLAGDTFIVGTSPLPDGRTAEVGVPLAHFAAETAEVGRGLALIVFLSGLAALLIAIAATARAFAPLRQATQLIADLNARKLEKRLPNRGTGDPVDLHAETLNAVLAQIDASFSRLRAFSSDAAHELRTPLNRIRNVVEVALLQGDDATSRSALEGVLETTEDLSELIQSLLFLAEIDEKRVTIEPAAVDLKVWIDRTAEVYAPLFDERGITFTTDSEPGRIEGDPRLLDRVLLNLLDNAIKHVPAGGRVELRARSDGRGSVITVDDSGPGVPERDRERIFDRFARLDAARNSPGSGLGLALAKAVARLNGGDLTVRDSPLGGARFVWRLP